MNGIQKRGSLKIKRSSCLKTWSILVGSRKSEVGGRELKKCKGLAKDNLIIMKAEFNDVKGAPKSSIFEKNVVFYVKTRKKISFLRKFSTLSVIQRSFLRQNVLFSTQISHYIDKKAI